MKVTLTHDGKSVELDLTAEQMTALGLKEEKKKTGYERAKFDWAGDRIGVADYYFVWGDGEIGQAVDNKQVLTNKYFNEANYYTDRDLACANARADRLMRQLRRFAAENGGIPSMEDWEKTHDKDKYGIYYDYKDHQLYISCLIRCRHSFEIYFNDRSDAQMAIDKFRDELIWYFTEYEAMLR